LSNLTDNMRKGLGLKLDASGLLVMDVDETSDAFEKGLRAGDLVTEAGQKKVNTVTEFQEQVATAIEGGRKTMMLLVRRGNDPLFLALSMKD
jgi:serine protease Do